MENNVLIDKIIAAQIAAGLQPSTRAELEKMPPSELPNLLAQISGSKGLNVGENFERSNPSQNEILTAEKQKELINIIKDKRDALKAQLDQTVEQNGFIGSSWDWLKNKTGFGDSSDKVRVALKELDEKIKLLEQPESFEVVFEQITGVSWNEAKPEEISLTAETALSHYKEGQEMAADMTGDIVSGVVSLGIYTGAVLAAPVTFGASIPAGVGLAAVSGAGIKTGIKYADAKSGGREYDSAGYDLATGAFSGALAPFTGGVGGAAGKGVAKVVGVQAFKVLGKESIETAAETTFKQMAKNALLNPAGYEYAGGTLLKRAAAQGAEFAVDGALSGGIDNAFRASLNGEDAGEAFTSGALGGMFLAPVIGGGFKTAGKFGSKAVKALAKETPDAPLPMPENILPRNEKVPPKAGEYTPQIVEHLTDAAQIDKNALKAWSDLQDLCPDALSRAKFLKIFNDEEGNFIQSRLDAVKTKLNSLPLQRQAEFIATANIYNLSYDALNTAADLTVLLQCPSRNIAEMMHVFKKADGTYYDEYINKLPQLAKDNKIDVNNLTEFVMCCQDKNDDFDVNSFNAIPELLKSCKSIGYAKSALSICKDSKGHFQQSTFEKLKEFYKIFNTEEAQNMIRACKNSEGLLSEAKLEKLVDLHYRKNYSDIAISKVLDITSDKKGDFSPELYEKFMKLKKNDSQYNLEQLIMHKRFMSEENFSLLLDKSIEMLKYFDSYGAVGYARKCFDKEGNFLPEVYPHAKTFIYDLRKETMLAYACLNCCIYNGKFIQNRADAVKELIENDKYQGMIDALMSANTNYETGGILDGSMEIINKMINDDVDQTNLHILFKSAIKKNKIITKNVDVITDLNKKGVLAPQIESLFKADWFCDANGKINPQSLQKTYELCDLNVKKPFGLLSLCIESGEFNPEMYSKITELIKKGVPQYYLEKALTAAKGYNIADKKMFIEQLQTLEQKVFAKRNLLKSGIAKLSDDDLYRLVYNNGKEVSNVINYLGMPVVEAAFALKADGFSHFCIQSSKFFDAFNEKIPQLLTALNPAKAAEVKLKTLAEELTALKKMFPETQKQGAEALNALKKQINDKNTEIKNLRQQVSSQSMEPNEVISKTRTLASLRIPEDVQEMTALIKSNTPTEEMLAAAQKDAKIMQAFENRSSKNQDFKTWYSYNVLKPQNDKAWNEALNLKIYNYLGIPFDRQLSERLGLEKSPYLNEILSSSYKFRENFKELVDVLNSHPEKSVKEALDMLPQNIATRKYFESQGINYDKWATADKNSYRAVKVELDAAQSRAAAISNLEEDFMDDAFKLLPLEHTQKILDRLDKMGISLKERSETIFDDDGFPTGNAAKMRLFKGEKQIEFEDLPRVISAVKEAINADSWWTVKDSNPQIEQAKATMYNHIMKLRDVEIKNAANLKENSISTLEIHKTDMNDISHALFLGNHGHCCTAVGTGCNQFSAPAYIMNNCISAIEVMDGKNFVGNTMCYIAEVDGKLALVLDNIEMSPKYQYNNQIRDVFMEYAKDLCNEIGKPDLPIFAGPYRHKFNMAIYPQANHNVSIKGSTGGQEIYVDYVTGHYTVDGTKTAKVRLYKIR